MMKPFLAAFLAMVLAGCASSRPAEDDAASIPQQGRITVAVRPNPIVARQVSGENYRFAFDVVINEVGGLDVEIQKVTLDVRAIGGLRIGNVSYDEAEIRAKGFDPTIKASSERIFRFNEVKPVGDERLLPAVTAELTVESIDAKGTFSTARTTATVRAE